jgi:NAD(P)-dependent dehydrogenase (short-subunit alcohol dehydrogenase family)
VGNAAEIVTAVAKTIDTFGSLDLLVANAGYCVYGDFEKLSPEDYERQMRVNVFGVLNTIRPALPYLKKSKGRIVITGSVSGHIGLPGRSAYAMSKFALRGLAESLSVELAGTGVSVTLVTPGYVRTSTRTVDRLGVYREEFVDSVPARLQMDPRTVAKKILRAAAWRRLEIVITGHATFLVFMQRLLPGLVPRILMLKQSLKRRGTKPAK